MKLGVALGKQHEGVVGRKRAQQVEQLIAPDLGQLSDDPHAILGNIADRDHTVDLVVADSVGALQGEQQTTL